MLTLAIVLGASYLLGSIPFGYLAGRIAGVDIQRGGSGNIGATNVLRVLGRRYGYAVFVLDFLGSLVSPFQPRRQTLFQKRREPHRQTGGPCPHVRPGAVPQRVARAPRLAIQIHLRLVLPGSPAAASH